MEICGNNQLKISALEVNCYAPTVDGCWDIYEIETDVVLNSSQRCNHFIEIKSERMTRQMFSPFEQQAQKFFKRWNFQRRLLFVAKQNSQSGALYGAPLPYSQIIAKRESVLFWQTL